MKKIVDHIHSRNKQWDIMRAIGIIFIVWGHSYEPPHLFFPASYFQLSLFFFISGYFFKPQITLSDKLRYFLRKTRKQLLPYFALNLFFGLLTMWLSTIGINLGVRLSLQAIFITPFGRGDQFALYLAAWFLFNLYFISIFAGLVFQWSNKINIVIIAFALSAMFFLLQIGNRENNSMGMVFLIRSSFGFGFFSFGYLFKLCESRIQKFIINPSAVIFLYILITTLNANFGNISYSILFGNVSNNLVWVPVATSLCIILIIYTIAFYGTHIFHKNSFIYVIGENSFSIMIWHFTGFFLVNVILYKLSLIPYTALSNVYYKYEIEKFWVIYQIPAIILPIFMVKGFNLLVQKIVVNPFSQDSFRMRHTVAVSEVDST